MIGFIKTNVEDTSMIVFTVIGYVLIGWWLLNQVKKNEIIYLTTKGQLIISEETPTKEIVEEFLQKLNSNIKEFLIKKYGTYDKDLPLEPQLNNFMMLKDREIISEEEFEKMKYNALGYKSETNRIGF